jgi:hypothetical protein
LPTPSIYADIFTKGLPLMVFQEFRSSLNDCGTWGVLDSRIGTWAIGPLWLIIDWLMLY